ncbi:MAG TPA: YhcH/YjgK/YiaL family protein [Candidatus Bariatricus faecipullorum]|nr:YhcH/YjgK/YiaL family protein [Candidatus Bariatricus faecipullorum]
MLTTRIGDAARYDYLAEKFQKAFRFLEKTDFSGMKAGKVEIDGDRIFAEIQEYTTKPEEECRFESHKKYFDIQYMAEGEEFFGYIPLEYLEPDTGYDESRDLEFYKAPRISGRIHLKKGDFAVVSPQDGHQPRCMGEAPCQVKKIVVKVLVDF